ncbi:hypothetical protein COV19_03800 [Candidatus Woesearchaeota archaeon CG10_big_fil_rev_8_21_14_0_10_44_13]|nr:MAG: hypothetical protein COV19_03800 [Candidatus Woesearchaeota archaeon CG10_big_fil_rev_8_21_14_0_10_44_13]
MAGFDSKKDMRNALDEDAIVEDLLNKAWESFKDIMKDQEIGKNILGRLFQQQNNLKGALNMAEISINSGNMKGAEGYLRQAEEHFSVLERFETMLQAIEEQARTKEKKNIKNISAMRSYTKNIKNDIEALRKKIQKMAA